VAGDEDRGCYLYGIIRDDLRPTVDGLRGVGRAPIAFVEEGPLAAVVADVSKEAVTPREPAGVDVAWLEDAVLAHEDVLERCLASGPVVPMRFATTFRTPDDVRGLLVDRRAELEAALERLVHRREWGVKGLLDPVRLAAAARAERPDLVEQELELESRSEGAAYFARKRIDQELAQVGEEIVAACVQAAHDHLAAVAVDARITPTATQTQARAMRVRLNAAYLVDDADEEEFRAAVESSGRAHAELGLRYELTGPWPPYNFVAGEAASP
jgi:gas vesicle protein GvpL/GvpF